jgi:GT2 family glycosyltransferase
MPSTASATAPARPLAERLTVVVLTFNRAAELAHTLGRLQALADRPRIIVVDNASGDGTAAMVRKHFAEVELVSAPANLGAAGRNLGVAAVRTPYVAFCDDDTWWAPGSLGRAADLLDAHPRIGVLNAAVKVGGSERLDPTSVLMARSPLPRGELPGPALAGFMAGACVFRASVYRAAGGYEPRLFIGAEEMLLSLDVLAQGWAIVYAEHLVLHHHPSPVRDSAQRRRLLARNAAWVAWMRLPLGEACLLSLRAVGTLLREGGHGIVDLLRGIPWALRRRRLVPGEVLEMRRAVAGPALREISPRAGAGEAGRDRRIPR